VAILGVGRAASSVKEVHNSFSSLMLENDDDDDNDDEKYRS
jgi:hypothetical protein